MEKCYNITVTGNVRDIGFRAFVENAGRLLDLSGFVFNAKNGGVKILCRGEDGQISEFAKEIMAQGVQKGAVIKDIIRQEIPSDIELPYPFSKVFADDDIDIGRKLDKGIELLKDIKGDTSALPDIKAGISDIKTGISDIKTGIGTLNVKFDTFNSKFDTFNTKFELFIRGQEEHNLRLEKILEKLAERGK